VCSGPSSACILYKSPSNSSVAAHLEPRFCAKTEGRKICTTKEFKADEHHAQHQCRCRYTTTTVSCPHYGPCSRCKAGVKVAVSCPSAARQRMGQDCPLHCAAEAHVLFPHEVKWNLERQMRHQHCNENCCHQCHTHIHTPTHGQAAQGLL